ncbi:hypothetical protein H5410_010315 [Solanum commersonii]|uniref:Uncharacterized protein n=1 Tax=Solanum commersonii TaxID=4109 RepID=A0A9J6AL04_SOLCO|nr:hypothetical protein H5410_010315 [Solanum commersonii]
MNITILLQHSGIWVSDVNYKGYKVDGIVVGESISFMNLKALILAKLEINGVRKDIEIRYIVDGNTCPLKIRNDIGVKLYLVVRRNKPGIGMYPLCIDTTEKMVGEIHNFDCSSGEIICVEGIERDTEALALVESRICDLDYILELNATNYITDFNSTDVKTALRPLIRGFDYCRPVVVVDAAHLGGAYKGTFISASTLDGTGCILPLAYGVVDTENDCS